MDSSVVEEAESTEYYQDYYRCGGERKQIGWLVSVVVLLLLRSN